MKNYIAIYEVNLQSLRFIDIAVWPPNDTLNRRGIYDAISITL